VVLATFSGSVLSKATGTAMFLASFWASHCLARDAISVASEDTESFALAPLARAQIGSI